MEEQNAKNANGIKSTVVELIESGRVDVAIDMFEDRTEIVKQACDEYDPKKHSIISRADKGRKGKSDYRTNKLPRNWQYQINEIELYFLMNNGVKWELQNDIDEQKELMPAFQKYLSLLKSLHYDKFAREAKRIAGAETECAKLYAYYKDGDEVKLKIQVLSFSNGYRLRPLFNRYGDLKSFAVGYYTKTADDKIRECWDVYTSENIYKCSRVNDATDSTGEWAVIKEVNPIGKIPVIYIRQRKAWAGVEERIERDEYLDSKNADCNEYISDPMLKISRRVKNGLADPKNVGKVIQIDNKDDVCEYLVPPDMSDMKLNEKSVLKESILMGTLTPDLSYENVKGLGAVAASAMTKANIIGYIKRLALMEVYDEYFAREANLIKEIMAECLYPEMRKEIRRMNLVHIYQDPSIGIDDNSEEIARWKEIGMSIEACVEANRNIHDKQLEIERIKREQMLAQENNKTTEE